MNYNLIITYFAAINLISGIFFAYDKFAAKSNKRRVFELTLHFLEIIGGIFANFLLMYMLKHKNRKFSYWIWTWLIMIGWVTLYFYFKMK